MQPLKLAIKRSQSECLSCPGKVISPSPIKQTSRISSRLASEIFDISSSVVDSDALLGHLSPTKPLRVRFCSARIEYEFSNEWNSDSSCTTSSQGDFDSPNSVTLKNPYHQENLFEDISADIPSRASNPIINDSNFRKYDQTSYDSTSQKKLFAKLNMIDF